MINRKILAVSINHDSFFYRERSEEFVVRAFKGGTKKATQKSTMPYWQRYLCVKESLPSRWFSLSYNNLEQGLSLGIRICFFKWKEKFTWKFYALIFLNMWYFKKHLIEYSAKLAIVLDYDFCYILLNHLIFMVICIFFILWSWYYTDESTFLFAKIFCLIIFIAVLVFIPSVIWPFN